MDENQQLQKRLTECFTLVQLGWGTEHSHKLYDKAWEFIRAYGETIRLEVLKNSIEEEYVQAIKKLNKLLEEG